MKFFRRNFFTSNSSALSIYFFVELHVKSATTFHNDNTWKFNKGTHILCYLSLCVPCHLECSHKKSKLLFTRSSIKKNIYWLQFSFEYINLDGISYEISNHFS
mmetsp:Transcript_5304/g.10821  ORF Transcript_5304/g.10821 Transcript_5304/m.10821 type:complete len:103 (+) Transcript_5304:1568-1876(+)